MTDVEQATPLEEPGSSWSELRELVPTIAAAVCYVAACLVWPLLLFNWIPALGFLLAVTWLLPALVRRFR